MIYPLAGLLLGGAFGGFQAKRRDGKGRDIAQWALVGAMIGGMIGLFILVGIERSLT